MDYLSDGWEFCDEPPEEFGRFRSRLGVDDDDAYEAVLDWELEQDFYDAVKRAEVANGN